MWITAFAAGLFAGAGLIIAIGAQNAFVLRQGLQRRHVGRVVLACAGADVALILAGVGGMGALVLQWPLLLQALRFGGAAFLLWYGVQAGLRAWRGGSVLAAAEAQAGSARQVLLTCLAFTLLNPHVYLDTVVLLGSLSTRYPGDLRWAFGAGRAWPAWPGSARWAMARDCCSRCSAGQVPGGCWMPPSRSSCSAWRHCCWCARSRPRPPRTVALRRGAGSARARRCGLPPPCARTAPTACRRGCRPAIGPAAGGWPACPG